MSEAKKPGKLKPEHILQYGGTDIPIDGLADEAKAAFRAAGNRNAVTDLKIYIKPEDGAAYYVINDGFSGKLDLAAYPAGDA